MDRLRKFGVLVSVVSVSTAILPTEALAYCVGWDKTLPNYDPLYYSVSHEFRRSRFVVKAKVLHEIWIGEDGKPKALKPPFQYGRPRPWGFDPYVGAFYDLQVETVFKGNPPATLRVFSENSTARFWLNRGEEILAFVSPETFDEPIGRQLTLDMCGNFRPFAQAGTILHAVAAAARRSR